MTYANIPKFDNLDYKSDIRDKVLVPLIDQHNKHSQALKSLEIISDNALELSEISAKAGVVNHLAEKASEIFTLVDSRNELQELANYSGKILGLDNRVTRIELNGGGSGSGGGSVDLSDINDKLDDHEGRITVLESKPGGGGGSVDLSQIEQDIADNKSAINKNSIDIANNKTLTSKNASDIIDNRDLIDKNIDDLSKHAVRIKTLEDSPSGGGSSSEPTKWYVLPMGGQSNCVGYGETPYDINGFDNVHPRIKQLGRYTTHSSACDDLNISMLKAKYGSRFDELRPHVDCNLKIIPATPCLDMSQNMFTHNRQNGGTVSSGMYVARALLPHIPPDYGILIVPCAYGGTGFLGNASNGSWNAAKIRAEGAKKHGKELNLSKDFYYRTKYALELNPENVLLPFVWVQGENDKGNGPEHMRLFKEFFDWFKGLFEADNLQRFLPEKRMDNFRFICLGATKWMLGADTETSYVKYTNKDWESLAGKDVFNRLSTYNNYAFLSNVYKTRTGSQLIYARADVTPSGDFVETNREYGTGDTTSNRQIHFSTRGYSHDMATNLANIIIRYSGVFTTSGTIHNRPVIGGMGVVSTDNVVFHQQVGTDFSRLGDAILLHQDFSSGTLTTNKGPLGTITAGGGVTLVSDPEMGTVASFPGSTSSFLRYAIGKGATSFTKSITFKPDDLCIPKPSAFLMVHNGTTTDGLISIVKNSLISVPDYTIGSARTCSLLSAAAVEGNWNGKWNDWQNITLVYSKEAGIAAVYLNGNLTQSAVAKGTPTLGGLSIGNASTADASSSFVGRVSSTRIYERALSHEDVKALVYTDLLSKLK